MVSEDTRRELWQQLADIGRLCRYYAMYADRMQRKHIWVRGALLFASLGGAAALTGVLPNYWGVIQPLAALLIAVAVGADYTFDFGEKAKLLHVIALQCRKAEENWHQLWLRANTPEAGDGDMRAENERLVAHVMEVTAWTNVQGITVDERINEKAEETSIRVLLDRYPA